MEQHGQIYVLARCRNHDFWGNKHEVLAASSDIVKLRKIMKNDAAKTKTQEEQSIYGFTISWDPKYSRNEENSISIGYFYSFPGCIVYGNDRVWTWTIQCIPTV